MPRRRSPSKPIILNDFRFGLNTVLPSASILPNETSMLVNFKILPLGGLEIREGLTRYTTSALDNSASYMADFIFDIDLAEFHVFEDTDDREWENSANREWQFDEPASSGSDELIVTQPDNKLYKLSATKIPSLITTLKGDATIIPAGDKAYICDGSFLKYWDKSSASVLLAYDDGTGSHGYQQDNTTLTPDTEIKLYSGGNTKAGVKFESQDWDAGYTITATKVEIYARKVGSPTGNVGCELYTNAGVLLATSTTIISAASVDTSPEKLSFVFDSGVMSKLTLYWAVITFSGSPGSEKVTDSVFESVTKAAAKGLAGITKAAPGVVTFDAGHGYANGDVIYFSGLNEMTELNTEYWVLRSNAGNTFELQATVGSSLDTSGYGNAEVTGGNCAQKCSLTSWTEGAGYYPAVDGAGALTNKSNAVASSADLEQDVSAVNGETYAVVFTLSGFSGTDVTPQVGDVDGTARSSNSTFTEEITATGAGNLKFQGDAFTGQIDTVSVKKVVNYIQLECDTVTSDGDGKHYDGSWRDDALKIGLAAIKPGRPPRARFGLIQKTRLYTSGDPFNKGIIWYSNVNTSFDWSTTNGGGYIGVVDQNVTNFPVGAMLSLYSSIFVFGQQSQPYLCKLLGDSPSEYDLPPMFQKIYSTHKTALHTVNDCWFGSDTGINALSGVEQYGDLRTFFESEAVDDRIMDYWTDDDAFAGYNGETGQYFLKMTGYPRCLVVHTKSPVADKRGRVRYPWTEYIFVKENLSSSTYKWTASGNEYYLELTGGGDPSISDPPYLLLNESILTEGTLGSLTDHQWAYGDNDTLGYSTVYIRDDTGDPDTTDVQIRIVLEPTAFANYSSEFFIACDDGYIYKLDKTVQDDNLIEIPYCLGTKLFESPYNEVCLEKYDVSCGTDATGATLDLEIYDQDVSVDTLHSVAADVSKTININTDFNRDLNANYKKFMAILRNIDPDDQKLRINNISLITRALNS